MAVAESSAEAMPKSGRRTSRGFPRHPHQYFWIGLACVIAAIANGASQQLTSLGTNPQVVLTWVSGLLAVGAIVAFGLSLRHGWLFSRPVRQYLWFSIACGLSFIAGLVAYQFTLPRTQLQFAVGWAILLSGVAGLLSASLARRSRKTGS
jgi:hypothetical protein